MKLKVIENKKNRKKDKTLEQDTQREDSSSAKSMFTSIDVMDTTTTRHDNEQKQCTNIDSKEYYTNESKTNLKSLKVIIRKSEQLKSYLEGPNTNVKRLKSIDSQSEEDSLDESEEIYNEIKAKNTTKYVLRRNIAKKTKKENADYKISKIDGSKDVVERNNEYKIIKNQLDTFIDSGIGSVLYITGVPGSGKTFTTVSLLKSMNCEFVYVNSSSLKNKTKIYDEIGNCTSCCQKEHVGLADLRNHYINCSEKHILVIDEVDFLYTKNETLLYNIFELPFYDNACLMLIVISNTLGCFSSKIESRIGKNRLEFKPYNSSQLKNVVLSAYKDSTINEKSLDLIVKRVGSSTGDIRKVKDFVESSGSLELSKIGALLKDASCPLLTKFIRSFNFYQKLILHVNRESKVSLQHWFNTFRTFCLAKNIVPLQYCDFLYVVKELVNFGIYNIKNDGSCAILNYLCEEIEQSTKHDADFIQFKSSKI